jgi:hypothetical protein
MSEAIELPLSEQLVAEERKDENSARNMNSMKVSSWKEACTVAAIMMIEIRDGRFSPPYKSGIKMFALFALVCAYLSTNQQLRVFYDNFEIDGNYSS